MIGCWEDVMISNVLLHVSGENAAPEQGPCRYAVDLAQAFGGHLTALVFELDVHSPTGADDLALTAAGHEAVNVRNRAVVRRGRELQQAAERAGVAVEVITDACYAYGVPGIVADHAKLNELTVAGIDNSGLLSERGIAEHVLFESGRPMIVVPKAYSGSFACDRIVVAWDFSRTAARALFDAHPFLSRASEVTVVTATDDKEFNNRLSGDRLINALARRDVAAQLIEVSRGSASIGELLLSVAHDRNADLLVMGGYGQSRWREFVLGGATRHILQGANLPVLMSH
jgi:nucleotide-binding universal stress UspA family protein